MGGARNDGACKTRSAHARDQSSVRAAGGSRSSRSFYLFYDSGSGRAPQDGVRGEAGPPGEERPRGLRGQQHAVRVGRVPGECASPAQVCRCAQVSPRRLCYYCPGSTKELPVHRGHVGSVSRCAVGTLFVSFLFNRNHRLKRTGTSCSVPVKPVHVPVKPVHVPPLSWCSHSLPCPSHWSVSSRSGVFEVASGLQPGSLTPLTSETCLHLKAGPGPGPGPSSGVFTGAPLAWTRWNRKCRFGCISLRPDSCHGDTIALVRDKKRRNPPREAFRVAQSSLSCFRPAGGCRR